MSINLWMAISLLPVLAACATIGEAGAGSTGTTSAATQQVAVASACASAEHRFFDFMIGDWRVVETASGKDFAHNRVEHVDGGCAIRENLRHPGGLVGSNTIFFSPADRLWHVFYHDSLGFYAHLTGITNTAGRQELTGDVRFPAQAHQVRKARQVSFKDGAGRPRQVGYLMHAKDVSWQMVYDLTFCPSDQPRADSLPPCNK